MASFNDDTYQAAFYKGKCLAYEAILRANGLLKEPPLIKVGPNGIIKEDQ